MTIEELKNIVDQYVSGAVVGIDEESSPQALLIKADQLLEVCQVLYKNKKTYFDMLSCITGVDNGVEANTMEVVYNLYSIPYETSLMLKVELYRESPVVPSLCEIWKTANWHEREAYDLLGIKFTGHPDLRRILLPADWKGHPLRKDYEDLDEYRGIKVDY